MSRFTSPAVWLLALVAGSGVAWSAAALKTTEFGKGPTIVFVHDVGMRGNTWMPVAKKLLGTYHTVMVDLPGHGESAMINPFSIAAAAEALDQALAKQEGGRTIVVGHGVGGLIALYAAKAHPQHVKGVVLVESGAAPVAIPDEQRKRFLTFLDEQENYNMFLRGMMSTLARDSAQSVAVHAQASQVAPATIKSYIAALLDATNAQAAKGLTVPVLFLGSDKKWAAEKDWAAVAKEVGLDAAPKATGLRIADSGYYVMKDQPDSLAARVATFAAETMATN